MSASNTPRVMPGAARDFATTRWSVVLAARADHSRTQDITQVFFARLLEKEWSMPCSANAGAAARDCSRR